MLSIGKLVSGAEDYYLDIVASGREDYYTGSGEAPGYWVGDGARELGLTGTVAAGDLRAVLAGVHPTEEVALVPPRQKRVTGFDLTFSAPKSVSVLWALSAEETAEAVRQAHDTAVAEAASYLRSHALAARRGHDGTERIDTTGFVAAAFRHRTSRATDPQLHTHLLVANLVRGRDGRWSAPDARLLYLHARTAGFVYQAALRAGLTESLGVRFGPVRRGVGEVEGVPAELVSAFSTRRHQIEEALGDVGLHSRRAAEVAALATRDKKALPTGPVHLRERWTERAFELGYGPGALEHTVGRPRPVVVEHDLGDRLGDELCSPAGLTAATSVFERRDVVRSVAERMGAGAHLTDLELLTMTVLDRPEVVRLSGSGPGGEGRHTTEELLETERRMITGALERRDGRAGVVGALTLVDTLADHSQLSDEQRHMVERLLADGHGVDAVIGRAGAGKTTALAVARAGWERAGYHVVGTALSARAAAQLQEGAGMASSTLARFTSQLESGELELTDRHVVVVDEAGMVGTRTLAPLLERTATVGAKVVLVGDPRQLPEIDAGGAFGALARQLDAPELTENRRQREPWERTSLAELRHGDVGRAIADFAEHGRLHVSGSMTEARRALVADWVSARTSEPSVRMLAATRADVDALNVEARSALLERGLLGSEVATAADFELRLGDAVICTRNDRRLGVLNGTRGTVVHANMAGGVGLLVEGELVHLPAEYLAAGQLTYGYVTTVHKSQGETVERSFVLGSASLFREAGYVAMSRARIRTDLYVADSPFEDGLGPDVAFPDELTRSLRTSRAKFLALEEDARCQPQSKGEPEVERQRTEPDLGLGR